ncbi:MAG: RtcB family protein [Bacteroidia bacterium]|nr:RtcB family protein [Bacteroidia bacterium]MBT8274994.1 RtcB family protein [Bacteroidia bacterium]NNF30116.1 RtcB family protein [Flavobacteriaceae bacterium]NNK55521.1 RtcB family protein [Flavobacteriaceae bacterium]NNM08118.1 RtcB family protein [Flavobacteriaceae bacterium]
MKKVDKHHIRKLENYLWEIPRSFRDDMRVPARALALESMLDDILKDRSLNQLVNVATLPGIQEASLVMPDVHEGYGFPIGGVAATQYPDGVISPGGIGYDINCGVRLLTSQLKIDDVRHRMEDLSKEMYAQIPSGMGKGGQIKLTIDEIDKVLIYGAEWAVSHGYGFKEDLPYIESHGKLEAADPAYVSEMAKKRGSDQLGTIGSGNHFVEVDYVDEIYDKDISKAYNLFPGQLVVLIHTGSRGLGHQVATDYIRKMVRAMPKYGIELPDKELACVPLNSEEGQQYFKAMCAAANYAWCNREVISWEVRNAWKNIFGEQAEPLKLLYDVAHNIAKIEDHLIDGELKKVIVHRKGATRSFGPGFEELPSEYIDAGQPVIIPGSMGTCSYILAGASAENITFGSCCHGAGRRLSRTAAKKQVYAPGLKEELRDRGIFVQAGSFKGIAEEAPIAYKDVNVVVETIDTSGVAKKVAKLRPVAVVKG